MAKKKATTTKAAAPASLTNKITTAQQATPVVFPEISLKEELECRTILDDQILVIDVGRCPSFTWGPQPDATGLN